MLSTGAVLTALSEQAQAADSAPNIVLISIDGMRADRAGYEGYEVATTPNLDALAASGARFPNAWSAANESLLSHAAMLTGRYPSELAHPDYLTYILPEEAILLPEALTAVGYDTAAFIGGGHIRESFGFNQGYETFFESQDDFGSFFETSGAALKWLEERSDTAPFFVFLHGYDLHRPYAHASVFAHPLEPGADSPLEWLIAQRNFTEHIYQGVLYADFPASRVWHNNGEKMLNPGDYPRLAEYAASGEDPGLTYTLSAADLAHIDRHYDASVLEADTYVGLFLEALVSQGLWENTIVIVTSDHGEDMQDHGYYNHRTVLYDSTTRVPFLIGGGGVPEALRGAVRSELVAAVDVVPTIMDLAGSVAPADSRGRSLGPLLRGATDSAELEDRDVLFQEGVLGQVAARTERWRLNFEGGDLTDPTYLQRLVTDPIDGGTFTLYDSYLDPDEQRDVLAAHPELAEAMRGQLVRWRKNIALGTASQELSPELRRMLQERGYW